MEETLQPIYDAVVVGNMPDTTARVQAALDNGVGTAAVLHEALIPAMSEVGRLFEQGEYFVPEMLIAARAMQAGLKILKPLLVEENIQFVGKIAIGTVKGDLHDIGKNLVAMMLEGAGFEIIDLGTNVAPETFIDSIKNDKVDMVAMSALLTTTMPNMAASIAAIKEAGLRDKVKIIIGGAPVTKEYAANIGADGYAPDASQAATLAKHLAL